MGWLYAIICWGGEVIMVSFCSNSRWFENLNFHKIEEDGKLTFFFFNSILSVCNQLLGKKSFHKCSLIRFSRGKNNACQFDFFSSMKDFCCSRMKISLPPAPWFWLAYLRPSAHLEPIMWLERKIIQTSCVSFLETLQFHIIQCTWMIGTQNKDEILLPEEPGIYSKWHINK